MKTTSNDNREKIHEPFWQTLVRTSITGLLITIAIRFGQLRASPDFYSIISILFRTFIYVGGVIVFLGHYSELFFINYLRYKFSAKYVIQILTRILYWYISGGLLFNFALILRAILEHKQFNSANWWMGGIYFIALELIANLWMQLTKKKSFWNGVY